MSLLATIFFGYSAINCLVFQRRNQTRIAEYKDRPLESIVHSPRDEEDDAAFYSRHSWTLWISGVVGVIGFAVSSWQLVLSTIALLHSGT
jgi:hypothetical protein